MEVGGRGLLYLLGVELVAIFGICVAWRLGVPLGDWTSPILRFHLRLSIPPKRRKRRRGKKGDS